MQAVLLAAHVLAGILFVGPVTVAASIFPRYVPLDPAEPPRERDAERSTRVARALGRICRVYGLLGLLVPAFGIALALVQDRFSEVWIIVAMGITAIAGGLLAFRIVPGQAAALASPPSRATAVRLGALAGIFNLLWVVVVVLMIVRPGSDYAP